MHRALPSLALLVFGACGVTPPAVSRPAVVLTPETEALAAAAIERAEARGVAESRRWLLLGHYRETTFGDHESEVDGPAFFLSPEGKTDPAAELAATLRAFYAPPPEAAETADDGTPTPSPHAICRFPARLRFLTAELGLDPARLPRVRCPGLDHFTAALAPTGVSLVFSAYYIGNPASAFGHTFLRIHRDPAVAGTERRELLDYGVDFSADVDTDNGVVYAWKGLTGAFPGTFKRIPYYYKVREYSDYESRDLWDYELAMTPAEVATLVAHLWELGPTWFDYYYVTENCSYHVLAALEVAMPRHDLTRGFGVPVIPGDTVKRVMEIPGLVRRFHHRPSIRAQLVRRLAGMTDEQLDAVDRLAASPTAPLTQPLPEAQLVAALDAAADLVDIRHAKDLVHEADGEGARKKHALLGRRATIPVPSPDLGAEVTLGSSAPHLAHGSARFGFGMGLGSGGRVTQTLDVRPAMHDVADAPLGYPELAGLEFFSTRLRLTHDDQLGWDDVALDVAAIRITSLSPLHRFERKPSWRFDLGAVTLEDLGRPGALAGRMRFAAAGALGLLRDRLVLFAGVDARLLAGTAVEGAWGGPVRLSLGPWAGLRLRLADTLVAYVTGDWLRSPWQGGEDPLSVDGTLRWLATEHLGLGLEARLRGERADAQLLALFYY